MRRVVAAWVAGLVSGAVAGGAAAETRFWSAAEIWGPYADQGLSTPSDAEVMAAWPAAAAARKTPGNAIATCTADLIGELRDCKVMVQRPANAGFGDALLGLASKYRLEPAKAVERPRAAEVLIAASWPVPDTPPAWLVEPKPGDFSTTASKAVWNSTRPIHAEMNCLLGRLGMLYQCVVVYQEPLGTGFGAMVLRLAPYLKFKPATLQGQPLPVGVTLPWNSKAGRHDPPPERPAK